MESTIAPFRGRRSPAWRIGRLGGDTRPPRGPPPPPTPDIDLGVSNLGVSNLGVDDLSGRRVVSAPAEQVARHVLLPEAVRPMVKNAISYPRMAVALGTVSGRGVPTSR